MNASLLLVPCLAFSQLPSNPVSTNRFVLTETEAVGMLPPKVVCEYAPTNISWSPDGRFLVIVRTDPKLTTEAFKQLLTEPHPAPIEPENSIVLVNVAKGTTQPIWSAKGRQTHVDGISWLPGTNNFVFITTTQKESEDDWSHQSRAYWVNAVAAKPQLFLESERNESMELSTSPLFPRGLFFLRKMQDEAPHLVSRVAEIRNDGRLGRVVALPAALNGAKVNWSEDGTRPVFTLDLVDEKSRTKAMNYLFDLTTGKEELVAELPLYQRKALPTALYVDGTWVEAKAGDKVEKIMTMWLKSRFPSDQQVAKIGADMVAVLSPQEDTLFAIQNGVGTLIPLVKMPKDLYVKARQDAEKARLMSDAKQCVLGLMMYAADYDDNLPPNNDDWMASLSPYLKNRSILEGFVYTHKGGGLGDIENPAKTEIGYKQGPGGRAVAYADGHVVWVPDKP